MSATRLASRCTDRKLRLLCLHGMYQDAATFGGKTKPLRGVSADVDFVFLDGPFTIVPPILARQSKRPSASCAASSKPKRVRCAKKKTEFRAWWRPLGIHQEDPSNLDGDRDVLMSFLREKLDEVGDVDGVVGFSQGASIAAWMCSEQARAELQWSPKLAVLIGSYLGSPQYSLDSGIIPDIASLHVFGSNDYVIPAAKSQQVVDIFKQQEQTLENRVLTSVHTQGHVIPKCDASRGLFESFLAVQQLRLLGSSSISSSASSETEEREDATPSEALLASQRACAL
ncbi:Ovarian cancer-associated protein 2 [Phytophthora pseudosyringae]|uniref:Ovarian cancer-associated protein 2 n=1 Tax=Phytophthora pseudosyringae TaxID=221518 RepID=A0A8T1WG43_9STRA|nr:Ovarian cancer-associated protein 2 [Phytophthora pseudosyringae]